jgi:hypothetical protein
MSGKGYNSKQMGDAGEMLVAATLTLHGIPSFTMPPNWPGYDVIAELEDKRLEKISVKCRHRGKGYIHIKNKHFDWLAIVLIGELPYQFFIIPRAVAIAKKHASVKADGTHIIYTKAVPEKFEAYRNNFGLQKFKKS